MLREERMKTLNECCMLLVLWMWNSQMIHLYAYETLYSNLKRFTCQRQHHSLFQKNSNKRFFFFNCQRKHHSFFKNFKPNLLLFAYDKRSTLYFSNFSNKIIYLLYKSKKASITFENIQIKHAHVKDDNQSSFKIFKFNFQNIHAHVENVF